MPSTTGKTYSIHPAIGVARLGNLDADPGKAATYFLGPEVPYEVENDGHRYKAGGRMKKQAQRFRIYEFEDGRATREVTLAAEDVAAIEWTVHLANRKAALDPTATGCCYSTTGVPRPADAYKPAGARNATVEGDARRALVIDPGPQSVGRPGEVVTCTGEIAWSADARTFSKPVTLGKIAVEAGTGRLLVFAGDGTSEGLGDDVFSSAPKLEHWANNDGWYDDTADGRVTANITFVDGRTVSLAGPEQAAWVLCAPPKYVPGVGYFTTLHDLAIDVGPGPKPEEVSFMRDIYPLLRSVSRLKWVNSSGAEGHTAGRGDFLTPGAMRQLADPGPDAAERRSRVFARLRNPGDLERDRWLMPSLPKEVVEDLDEQYDIAAVTPLQYRMFQRWSEGDFVNDYDDDPGPVMLDKMAIADQPSALDRAALGGTAGTPFWPGIESWRIMRDPTIYAAPLRLVAKTQPGDMTIGNALPWQADFLDCDDTWWPVQRPNFVMRDGEQAPWIPKSWGEGEDLPNYNEMVRQWWRLGMIVSRDRGVTYQEEDRSAQEADA